MQSVAVVLPVLVTDDIITKMCAPVWTVVSFYPHAGNDAVAFSDINLQ